MTEGKYCVIAGVPIRITNDDVIPGPLNFGLVTDVSVLAAVITGSSYSYIQTTLKYGDAVLFDLFIRNKHTGCTATIYAPLNVIHSAIVIARGFTPDEERAYYDGLRTERLLSIARGNMHPTTNEEIIKIHNYIEMGVY